MRHGAAVHTSPVVFVFNDFEKRMIGRVAESKTLLWMWVLLFLQLLVTPAFVFTEARAQPFQLFFPSRSFDVLRERLGLILFRM